MYGHIACYGTIKTTELSFNCGDEYTQITSVKSLVSLDNKIFLKKFIKEAWTALKLEYCAACS